MTCGDKGNDPVYGCDTVQYWFISGNVAHTYKNNYPVATDAQLPRHDL